MYGLYQIVYFTIIDIINTLKSPFFIAVLCIIYFQYLKIGKIEKENLGYKRSALLKLFISTILLTIYKSFPLTTLLTNDSDDNLYLLGSFPNFL
mgnify:CR=1 FL=1